MTSIRPRCGNGDRHLEATLAAWVPLRTWTQGVAAPAHQTTCRSATLRFDVRARCSGVLGVESNEIHGMGPSLSLKLVGECGTDLRALAECQALHIVARLAPGTRSPAAKFYHPERGDHPAVRRPC